ncbi:unnamed protein product [Notodromas monacha]|uniref:Peptidase C45 hydrolase domain-containing protein n=1 Tax=Notodromas monacha TaxID=399045 RepID=A0A7R9BME0_9CRUS|nr:unnamed protein product [Notodromas monacha]CAG0917067.1 unnamed protein product [Notodromas monacha]
MADKEHRCSSIPVLHVRGNYYDVGYSVGTTFKSQINDLVDNSPEVATLDKLSNTDKGKAIFNASLRRLQRFYPQYLRELQGTSDGAGVPFKKLFLLHLDGMIGRMDDIRKEKEAKHPPFGCSTFSFNFTNNVFIGHNEDALPEFLNHWYVIKATIDDVDRDGPEGKHVEERFVSVSYAGLLPGFCLGWNNHGLAYTINVLFPKHLSAEGLPRHFICRALLTATSLQDVERILAAKGAGSADGMSVNLGFFKHVQGDQLLHNIEVAPGFLDPKLPKDEIQSQVEVYTISPGEQYSHFNAYDHLKASEQPAEGSLAVKSSQRRQATTRKILKAATLDSSANAAYFINPKSKNETPSCKTLLCNLLGDSSDKNLPIFRCGTEEDFVKTIQTEIINFTDKTVSLFTHNPLTSTPILVMNLEDV